MKKVLVLYGDLQQKEELEEIFGEAVLKGLEILFVEHENVALQLIQRESVHLILLCKESKELEGRGIPALKYSEQESEKIVGKLLELAEASEEIPM